MSPTNILNPLGHNVEGYSPQDMTLIILEGRKQILDGLDQVDVFVNNACQNILNRDKQSCWK